MNKMKYYAVVGHPVKHSLSPKIHARFAQQIGISLSYDAVDVPVGNFSRVVRQFFEAGNGLNVTLPFKQEAFSLAEQLTARAQCAQAVNTLWVDSDDKIHGDNTDGIGLATDLMQNLNVALKGQHILIAGAGGAVRGVLKPLLDARPASITLINRTYEKAEALAAYFCEFGPVKAENAEFQDMSYDVVINGTSTGLEGQLPPIPANAIGNMTTVYDMMYGKSAKGFVQWALKQGAAQVSDGLGMLVEQAAEAFFIWHGVRPKTEDIIPYFRDKL